MLCRISFLGDGAPSDILRQILKPSNCGIVAWVRLFPRDRSIVIQKNKILIKLKESEAERKHKSATVPGSPHAKKI